MSWGLHFDAEIIHLNSFWKKLGARVGGPSSPHPPWVTFPRSDPKFQKTPPRVSGTSQKFCFCHLVPNLTQSPGKFKIWWKKQFLVDISHFENLDPNFGRFWRWPGTKFLTAGCCEIWNGRSHVFGRKNRREWEQTPWASQKNRSGVIWGNIDGARVAFGRRPKFS